MDMCYLACVYRTPSGYCGSTGGAATCPHRQKIQTNGDRIRAMSDEELAEEMSVRLSEDCLMCPVLQADCPVWDETKNVECKDAMLNWLREESDNG